MTEKARKWTCVHENKNNHVEQIHKLRIQNDKVIVEQKKVQPFVLIIKNEQSSKLCCCDESKNHKKLVNDAHATSKPNKPRPKWYITTNDSRKIHKLRIQNDKLVVEQKKIQPFVLIIKNEQSFKLCCCDE